MSEQTAEFESETGEHVVIKGTVISELQENMKAEGMTASSVAAITELAASMLELSDAAVAKNDLKPEIMGIYLTRKADGSPFFTIKLALDEKVQPSQVTTLTDRVQQNLDARRTPTVKKQRLRAIDMTQDHDTVEVDE